MSVIDWLSNLVQGVNSNTGIKMVLNNQLQHPNDSFAESVGRNLGSIAGQDFNTVMQPVGSTFNLLSSADPTQIITRPVANAFGKGGTEWDQGLLGLTGVGFDKADRALTYLQLTGAPGHTPGLPNQSAYNRKAWDMAFAGGDHVTFGEATLGNASLVTDPNGLANFRHEIAGTWYGDTVKGALDFISYAAIDPTKGLGKVSEAARAASFVSDAAKADKLANTLNTALDAGEKLPTGNVTNSARAFVGAKMSDRAVAGFQWEAKGNLDNVTDVNHILNEIEPRLGMGGGPTKGSLPAIAELYADAARSTTDIALQRQIKLNVDYALTGSTDAMNWLAKNYPGIAAKGRRMSGAPSEFTLLEDVMNEYRAKGGTGDTFIGSGDFNLGDHIVRHYSDPAQQAELLQYGEAVERLQKFKAEVWASGPEGGPVEFGTTAGGVQIVPRNLEKLKTAMNNKVLDDHMFQAGPTGRTMRVFSSLTTPGAHGAISIVDPVLGNRQLISTLRQYSDKVDDLTPAHIRATSQAYLAMDPASRARYIKTVNDDLLARIGNKYGYDEDQIKEILTETSKAFIDGRQYASKVAKQASAMGNPNAYLGDLGGTDSVLNAEHLLSHLNDTEPLLDWATADEIVRSRRFPASKVGKLAKEVGDATLQGVSGYHTAWKYAQLGRPGLIARVLMDTDLRANSMIGSGTLFMQALRGAWYAAQNAHNARIGDVFTTGVSSLSRMQANDAARTAEIIRQESNAERATMRVRQRQIDRAQELADTFARRQRNEAGQFHSMTAVYRQRALDAQNLADKLRSDYTAVGSNTPVGLQALQKQRQAAMPARKAAIESLQMAEARYATPTAMKASNAAREVEHSYKGVSVKSSMVQDDLQWATLPDEIRGSGSGLSDLLLSNMDENNWRGRVEANHWQDHVDPTSVNWTQKYSLAMQEMRDSYTVRRLLVEADAISSKTPAALLRSYLNDPAVRNEFLQTMGGGSKEEFTRWLSDLATSVKSMTRDENLKAALLDGRVLTPQEIEKLVPVENRFPIFGPNIVLQRNNIGKRAIDGFFKTFVDMPDVYMARIPAAVGLYHKNMEKLLPAYAEAALAKGRNYLMPEEAQELHLRAKGRAMNDARRDMYDIHRRIGAHGVMRYIAPFFAPWYDAMQSWSRLIYDDPSRLGQLLRYSNTPDMFNLTTDRNGNPVQPWSGVPITDKIIQVPLFGLGGLQSFGVAFGSMNTITQGNTPFSPGVGPLAQVSGTYLVTDVLPKVAPDVWNWMAENPDNLVSQTLFPRPGDIAKGDVKTLAGTQMPSYMRTFSDVLMGADGFGNVYTNAFGTRYNDLIRQWREDHGGADPDAAELHLLQKQASSGARAAALARSVVSFNLGLSGNSAPEGQFYVDKMHALVAASEVLHQQGLTPEQVFAANYPTASNLNWSYSVNEGNLQATVSATTNYMKNRELMNQHPDIQWWIAGPDNIVASSDPNHQFSQSAYNQQMTEGLRRKYNEEEFVKQTQIAMGQGKMNAFNNALRLYMAQNGISSTSAKNAGGLATLKANYQAALRAQFPAWAEYYDALNSQGLQGREIDQIKSVIESAKPELRSRPDVQTTMQYLNARDQIIAQAHANGIVGWQTAAAVKPQRDLLYAYGQKLAASDIVFAQAWDRLFENEFNSDLLKAKQAALTGEGGSNNG